MPARSAVVAEDDPTVRSLLVRLLADLGYAVRAVADGRAALDEVARRPPDLLVTNEFMPAMDGPWLVRELRALGFALPVLLVSETRDDPRLPGVVCVGKPFKPEAFRVAVAAATGRR